MKYYYDMHIHSALSPCGGNDMTPNNIVNMAALKGLDIIAVSDHNSCLNAAAAAEVGKQAGVIVVPAMEIESAEEVHILSLFPDIESAEKTGRRIAESLPPVKNREDIFGEQLILDSGDEETGRVDTLLISASMLTVEEVFAEVEGAGGIAVPAHVDRSSYSMISNLGAIPEDLGVSLIELSASCDADSFFDNYPGLAEYPYLRNSDAHYLWDISEKLNYISTDKQIGDAGALISLLKSPRAEFTLGSEG
ncbi:MAG: PHP domain-containing protein [Anaerovoracaceae bacterium]